jgi:hypothetical protein
MDQWLALVLVPIICSNKRLEFSQITTATHSRSDMCEIDPRELSPFRANRFRVETLGFYEAYGPFGFGA